MATPKKPVLRVQTYEVTPEQAAPRRRAQPPPDPAVLLERFKDFPGIDVISRRFQNPNDPGSLPILLKDEDPNVCTSSDHQHQLRSGATTCHQCRKPARKWYVRYFNLTQEGRHAQMRAKGFIPVEISDLQDADDVADLFRSDKDRYVRRGDRGQELLAKMPLELWNEIKRRQRDQRMADSIDARKLRDDLAEAAGTELGDEAGQDIYDGGIKVERVRLERSTLGAEAEMDDVEAIDV